MSFDFTALLETARDSSLDDEARLLAVMTITSKVYQKRARLLEITEDRPGRPRQPIDIVLATVIDITARETPREIEGDRRSKTF